MERKAPAIVWDSSKSVLALSNSIQFNSIQVKSEGPVDTSGPSWKCRAPIPLFFSFFILFLLMEKKGGKERELQKARKYIVLLFLNIQRILTTGLFKKCFFLWNSANDSTKVVVCPPLDSSSLLPSRSATQTKNYRYVSPRTARPLVVSTSRRG